KFILVINDDDEAMNYNSVKDATADSVKKKKMVSHEIELIRKESLLPRNEYLHLKNENERKLSNSEHSSYIVKNKRRKRISSDLEIGRLLNKLNLIDPSLAYIWCQIFKSERNDELDESHNYEN
ncbi:15200_t:CDS:2, partial [Gigaspora margarita]